MSLGKVYLASGWFSPEWLEEVENIKAIFEKNGISYFSPKDENLCDNDAAESMQDQIFKGNLSKANQEGITLEWKAREPKPVGKGKVTVTKTKKLAFASIKKAKVIIK